MESKLIFIVQEDSTYTYISAIDNVSGSLLIDNSKFHTFDDEWIGVDEQINEFARELGKEILAIHYL